MLCNVYVVCVLKLEIWLLNCPNCYFLRQEVDSKRNYPRVILLVESQMFIAQVLQLIFTTLELHIRK